MIITVKLRDILQEDDEITAGAIEDMIAHQGEATQIKMRDAYWPDAHLGRLVERPGPVNIGCQNNNFPSSDEPPQGNDGGHHEGGGV